MTLIGATTENPYFEVNSALLSPQPDLRAAGARAGRRRASCSSGRSPTPSAGSPTRPRSTTRRSTCSPCAPAATPGPRSPRSSARSRPRGRPAATIDLATAEDALQRKAVSFDKGGDQHYDYASALIKSMRGSDPDAALYYLAAMLEGGEDPRFIARRMVILASEDIGNADPQALVVATAAGAAVDRVGLPECALNLAQAAVYLAMAPKSNRSYKGLRERPGAHPRARRQAAARLPARRPLFRARRRSAAARATSTPTTSRAASPTSRCCRRRSRASASTSRPTAASRPSSRSGSRSCAGAAGSRCQTRPPPVSTSGSARLRRESATAALVGYPGSGPQNHWLPVSLCCGRSRPRCS